MSIGCLKRGVGGSILNFLRAEVICEQTNYRTNITVDCFCNGLEFTQSHRGEEVMPDSYDKCKLG